MTIDELVPLLIKNGERWIADQRRRFRPIAKALAGEDRSQLLDSFSAGELDLARIVWVDEIENPGFYAAFEKVGLPIPLDFRQMTAITFVDTVVIARGHFEGPLAWPGLIFHELVHVIQYQLLGVDEFVTRYVQGWASGGLRYERIPLEVMAYQLQRRYEAGERFQVELEVSHELGIAA